MIHVDEENLRYVCLKIHANYSDSKNFVVCISIFTLMIFRSFRFTFVFTSLLRKSSIRKNERQLHEIACIFTEFWKPHKYLCILGTKINIFIIIS